MRSATEDLLRNIDLPEINKEQFIIMDWPITTAKLHEAILHMANNKALEPDGLVWFGLMASRSTHFPQNGNRF